MREKATAPQDKPGSSKTKEVVWKGESTTQREQISNAIQPEDMRLILPGGHIILKTGVCAYKGRKGRWSSFPSLVMMSLKADSKDGSTKKEWHYQGKDFVNNVINYLVSSSLPPFHFYSHCIRRHQGHYPGI